MQNMYGACKQEKRRLLNVNLAVRLVLLNMYEGAKLGVVLSVADAENYTGND